VFSCCFFLRVFFVKYVESGLSVEQQAHVEWTNKFGVFLESSEHAQFRTYVAIKLLHADAPKSVARGKELIHEVLNSLNPDPVSLRLLPPSGLIAIGGVGLTNCTKKLWDILKTTLCLPFRSQS